MKTFPTHQSVKGFLILFMSTCLFAFTPVIPGGDSYTIHLNNNRVVEHFVFSKAALPVISLAGSAAADQLSVYYNECGKIGTARRLSVKDNQGRELKSWSFNDTTSEHTPLTCTVGDLQRLKHPNNNLTLYYTSREVSKGQALATLSFDGDRRASRN